MSHLRGSIREHLLINSKPLTPWEDIKLLVDNYFSNSYSQQASRPAANNMVQQDDINVIKKKGKEKKGKGKGKGKSSPSASSLPKVKGKKKNNNKGYNNSKGKGKGKGNNNNWNSKNYNSNWNYQWQASWTTTATTTTTKGSLEEKETKDKGHQKAESIVASVSRWSLNISVLLQHQRQQCSTSAASTSSAV